MEMARVWRVAAALLLLFAAVDVLVPGLCVADSEQPGAAVHVRSPDEARLSGPDLDRQHDDCFCCCPHIIPGIRQMLRSSYINVADVADRDTGATDLSPTVLYHPPQLHS